MKKAFFSMLLLLIAGMAYALTQLQRDPLPLEQNKLEVSAFSADNALAFSAAAGEQRYSAEQNQLWVAAIPTTQSNVLGNYIHDSYNNSVYPTSVTGMYVESITAGATANAINLSNMFGAGGTIAGTLDLEAGTVSFAGGQVVGKLDGLDAKLYLADFTKMQYYHDPIVARVSPRGILLMPQMLVVLSDGRQMMCFGDIMYKLNATQTDYSLWKSGDEAVNTYPIHYSKTNSSQVLLKNFYGYGYPVTATIDTVGNMTVPYSQVAVGTTSSGSTFSARNYKVTAINYNNTPPTATLTTAAGTATFVADSIVTGSYCVAGGTTTNQMDLILKSVIKVQASDAFKPMDTSFEFKGSGTKEDPWQIATAEDLITLARASNYNPAVRVAKTFAGRYFVQTADIDLAGVENFEPISWNTSYAFSGTYDGQNHVISNLTVSGTRGADYHSGLFGELGADGVVKNIKFEKPVISSTSSYVGTVAGHAYGLIENIQVNDADISMPNNSASYCGGIAGLLVNNCRVHDCSVTGTVAGQSFVGGIGGNSNGSKIRRCVFKGNVKSVVGNATKPKIGGILGYCTRDTAMVEDCLFLGMITVSADEQVGGILGGGQKGQINRCWSAAQILHRATSTQETATVGGIVGAAEGSRVNDCLYTGIAQSYATQLVGGLVGTGESTLNSSLNLGTIFCAGNVRNNELTGDYENCTITNSYYDNQAGYNYGTENGLSTATLASGTLPQGLSADVWSVAAGKYPMLKQYASYDRATLDVTPFFLANNENVMGIRTDFTLGEGDGVKWYMLHNLSYASQGNGLKIEGNNVKVTATTLCSDTIIALKDDQIRMIPVKVTPKEFPGDGTAASPYLIYNLADLTKVFKAVDEDLYDYSGTYFRLEGDIDYTGVTGFVPYSHNGPAYAFNGVLDGNGHTIKNFVLPPATSTSKQGCWMQYTGPQSVIKNLTFDSSCSFNGKYYVAPVQANYGRLEGIVNLAPATASYACVAGIAANVYAGGEIVNCFNAGTITGGYRYAGGIAAEAAKGSLIQGCQNAGNVSSVTTFDNDDETNLLYIGGIVGDGEGAVLDCLNQGVVSGYGDVGGIVGSFTGSDSDNLRRCLNTGVVLEGVKNSTRGAVVGSIWSYDGRVGGNYFDKQFGYNVAAENGDLEGATGLTTAKLTSGEPVDSLSTTLWKYEAGKYPVLKAFADQEASKWHAASYVKFVSEPKLESRFDKRSDATIVLPAGSKAELKTGFTFSIEGTTLKHESSKIASTDTIILSSADGRFNLSAPIFATPKILSNGSGVESDPWLINTAADWNIVANYSNTYQKDFDGEYFKINADLDFKEGFEPICVGNTVYFNGVIDGNDKTIKNIIYENADQKYVGLIGSAGARSKVYNLTMDSTCNLKGNQYVGAIVGSTEGEVHHITNYATVTTTTMQYAAGVAGEIYGNAFIHHCTNYGTITSSNNSGAAGIAAYSTSDDTRIEDCVNYGPISAKGTCGGIASTTKGSVTRCDNHGKISSTNTNAGGICGYIWAVATPLISYCNNYADVTSTGNNAGGIVGYMQGTGHIANCVNYGKKVTSGGNYAGGVLAYSSTSGAIWSIKNVENHADVDANAYVGGIIGYSNSTNKDTPAYVDSAVNYGNVNAIKTNYAGGIAGNVVNYVELRNVYNYGESVKTVTYSAGGIAGRCVGKIINAYNQANVTSTTYNAGGICGESNTSTVTDYGCEIKNVINTGNVKSLGTTDGNSYKVAGILGTGRVKVENAVNFGDVEGRKCVAGIVGLPVKGSSATVLGTQVINSYNAARVTCTTPTTANNVKTCGAIMGDNTTAVTYTNIENCYYDTQMAGSSMLDTYADATKEAVKGVTTSELFKAALGSGFTTFEDGYAVPVTLADKDFVAVTSAAVVLKDGDHADNVTGSFKVTSPKGATWSGPDMTFSSNGAASWSKADLSEKTPVTVTSGDLKRVVMLQLTATSGVETIENANAEVSEVQYYNLQGVRIAEPQQGVNVKVTIYNDGTRKSERVIVGQR